MIRLFIPALFAFSLLVLAACGGTAVPEPQPTEEPLTAGAASEPEAVEPFVQKFDNDGNFIGRWGGEGTDDGQFMHATGITADAAGNIYVAEYEGRRVQKF